MIAKILIQFTNIMMALIAAYINSTFFTHVEMNNAHILFSNVVFIGCFLSFALFVAFVFFDVKHYEKVFPYDALLLFIALFGTTVTAVSFML